MSERPDFQVRGEWDNEPDREDFQCAELPCLILRGPRGTLCGYVGVTEGHSAFKAKYDDVDVDVHGGLTWGDMGDGERWPGDFYWLGFDCAHVRDYAPPTSAFSAKIRREYHGLVGPEPQEVYRNWAYVKREVENLARQLAALEAPR